MFQYSLEDALQVIESHYGFKNKRAYEAFLAVQSFTKQYKELEKAAAYGVQVVGTSNLKHCYTLIESFKPHIMLNYHTLKPSEKFLRLPDGEKVSRIYAPDAFDYTVENYFPEMRKLLRQYGCEMILFGPDTAKKFQEPHQSHRVFREIQALKKIKHYKDDSGVIITNRTPVEKAVGILAYQQTPGASLDEFVNYF
ncbi:EI24 domain-containing protein [Nanoarchaeota archaeon]